MLRRAFASPVFVALLAGLIAAGIIGYTTFLYVSSQNAPAGFERTTSFKPQIDLGGDFALVDQTGEPVTNADFESKSLLIYFGFTYCPDICPTDLAIVGAAMDDLAAKAPDIAERVQPLFVTIDPERDTPDVVGDYASAFHPKIIGLTGTLEQVEDIAAKYRVFYSKRALNEDGSEYLMDHSTFTYLVGEDGRVTTMFPHNTGPEEISAVIAQELGG